MIQPAIYRFETNWQLQASLPAVWDVIYATEQWPAWWKGILSVTQLRPADADGLHAVNTYALRSRMPYVLRFNLELVEEVPRALLRCACTGDLEGEGIFHITATGGIINVRYNWNVRTKKRWMNVLAPLARPFFNANHREVMRWGAEGLAGRLGAPLVGFSSRP